MRAGGIEERCLVLALPLLPVLHPAFIHICFTGDLETCPFAPYSDINLNDVTLKEGLGSVFLRTIRENHSMLTESMGGCTLWENRNRVASVLEESRVSEEKELKYKRREYSLYLEALMIRTPIREFW